MKIFADCLTRIVKIDKHYVFLINFYPKNQSNLLVLYSFFGGSECLCIVAKEGVAMTILSPKPWIMPSRASIVFLIFEIALFVSIVSLCLSIFMSIIAIV